MQLVANDVFDVAVDGTKKRYQAKCRQAGGFSFLTQIVPMFHFFVPSTATSNTSLATNCTLDTHSALAKTN